MNDLVEKFLSKIAYKFKYQDPRAPQYLFDKQKPIRKMDSPVYRVCHEVICEGFPIKKYLEIGVKEGGNLDIVLGSTKDLELLVLCDFWTVNSKKTSELETVKQIIRSHKVRHPNLKVIFKDGSSGLTLPEIDEQFDLIGIDGSHRFDIFLNDLAQAERLINIGGMIVIDDLILHQDMKIDQALSRYVSASDTLDFIFKDVSHWPGGAVLKKTNDVIVKLRRTISAVIMDKGDAVPVNTYPDSVVKDYLSESVKRQDWEAVDILISSMSDKQVVGCKSLLLSLIERRSLEIENTLIIDRLKAACGERSVEQLPSGIIDGLKWRSQDLVL